MKAVIMAGGEGARLRPLTCDRPKPMVPLMDRPIMEYIIELLVEHGIREQAVTLQYLPEQIGDYFGDGLSHGVSLHYFLEDEPLGTAGSVKNASSFLDETFLVISGDCLTDINLGEAIAFHRQKGAFVTIVLTPQDNPLEYGVVMVNEEGKIIRFLEKPSWGEVFSDTVNTGIYIIEPEVLDYIPPGKKFDFSKDLFPLLLKEGKALYGCSLEGYWCDIGNLEQYRQTNYDVLGKKVKVNLHAWEKKPGLWIADDVQLDPTASLVSPLYIGKGCYIGPNVYLGGYTAIGSHSRLADKASIKRGITWSQVSIGEGAVVRGGMLAGGARLGKGAMIYEGAVIGDKTVVEDGALLKPGVKLWPFKRVESGAIVHNNLIWGGKARRSLFGSSGVEGEIHSDLALESTLRLGSAFAFLRGGDVPMVTGADSFGPSQLLKRVLDAGLMAGGADVLDIGTTFAPALRMSINEMQARGGIYVHSCSEHAGHCVILFFDNEGLRLSHGDERKLEQIHSRDDFPRALRENLGTIKQIPGYNRIYARALQRDLAVQRIRDFHFSILLAFPAPHVDNFLTPLFQELECRLTVAHYPGKKEPICWQQDEFARLKKDFSRNIIKEKADLGLWMSPSGEEMLLFDGEGYEISGEIYQALLSLLILRGGKAPTLVQPFFASWVHEELARRNKGQILRSKTMPRHFQEKLWETQRGESSGKKEYRPADYLQLDAMTALFKILDCLAREEKSLSNLLEEIPGIRLQQREVFCPWGQKGRVMRRLVEEGPGKAERIELFDGVKYFYPNGWALVLPDPEKPSYRIYGEGFTEEISESLTGFLVEKVKNLQEG
ncbi:MAG TPA: NTP transferase domain-containing protein [Firmicutes bacterium]|nr:NTP transferase domain-containing protein [Bacillota bacterium]